MACCLVSFGIQLCGSEALSSSSSSTYTPPLIIENCSRKKIPISKSVVLGRGRRRFRRKCWVMVQQGVQGPSAAYAREMERLSAKESLLVAFKDAGGFEALVSGKTTDLQLIDVNERIVALERLNPTSRPTTSPYLVGKWNFEWFGTGSPGLFAARFLFQRFPRELATLLKMDVFIKDGYAYISASVQLLNSIQSNIKVSTKFSVEGPLRMKEEYIEGVIESPKVSEENIPLQLKGAYDQATTSLQQLSTPIRDVVAGGLKVPLGGTFERLFFITYLDDEILVIRDVSGIPEVLTRLDPGPSPVGEPLTADYES